MKRINHLEDCGLDSEGAEVLIVSAFEDVLMRVGACAAEQVFAEFLAFKFWHENLSFNVNDSIQVHDVDYIRLNWGLFRKQANKFRECDGWNLPKEIDCKFCAEVLAELPDCVSYKHPKEVYAILQKVFKDESYIGGLCAFCKEMRNSWSSDSKQDLQGGLG